MIGIYPFMNYPGAVLAHPELPGNQWSFLSPEGIFDTEQTLVRWNGFIAGWKDLPGGGCAYDARSDSGRGNVRYAISLVPSEAQIDLAIEVTNLDSRTWHDVMVDMCLMHIRAPQFYDPHYERTFIDRPGGLTRVADLAQNPHRPLFIREGRSDACMHFYQPPKNRFWHWPGSRTSGNRILTRSLDSQWTVSFEWQELQLAACNWDLEHGCIHADPFLGTIEPGQTARMKGMIRIARSEN